MRRMKRGKRFLAFIFTLFFAPLYLFWKLITGRIFRHYPLPSFPEKILIVEMFGIGDFVMTTSTFKAVRERFPRSRIVLLTIPVLRDLTQDCPYFDEVVYFKCPWPVQSPYKYNFRKMIGLIKYLRRKKFDIVIDIRGDLRNILFMSFLGAEYRIGYTIGGGSFLLTHKIPYNHSIRHQVDHNLNIARFLGAKINSPNPELWVKDSFNYTTNFLQSVDYKEEETLIAIHPGANWYGRQWRLDRLADLINRLNRISKIKTILVGSSRETFLIKKIRKQTLNQYNIITRDLKELALLIQKCHLLVCNDSAPMHIAIAVGTPVVALFGPQDPAFHGPYGDTNIVIRHKVKCSPCTQSVCINPRNWCMDLIGVEEVYNSVLTMIRKKNEYHYRKV